MSFPLTPINGDYFNTFNSNVFKYNLADNMWLKLASNNKEIYNFSIYSKYLKEEYDEYSTDNNDVADLNLKFLKEVTAPAESLGIISIDLSSEGMTWTIPNTTGTPNTGSLVIYNKKLGKEFYVGKYINGNNVAGFEIGSGHNVSVNADEVTLDIVAGASTVEAGDTLVIYSNEAVDLQFTTGFGAFFGIDSSKTLASETIIDIRELSGDSVFKLEFDATQENFLLNTTTIAAVATGLNNIAIRFYSAIETGLIQNYCYLIINGVVIEQTIGSKYALKVQNDTVLNYAKILTINLEEEFTFSKFIGKNEFYGLLIQKDTTSFPLKKIATSGGSVEPTSDTTVLRDADGKSKVAATLPEDPDGTITSKGYVDSKVSLTGNETVAGIKIFSSQIIGSIENVGGLPPVSPTSATAGIMKQNGATKSAGEFYSGTDAPSNSNRLNYDGEFHATTFNAVSKREYKENIIDFQEKALDIIDEVKIVKFNFKEDKKKTLQIGFIADDTHEYLSSKEHDRVEIISTLGILIKAIQELREENKELRKLLEK